MQLTCICGDNFSAKYKHLSAGEFWNSKTVYCFFGTHNLGWEGQSGLTYRLRRRTWHRRKQTLSGKENDNGVFLDFSKNFGKYGVAFFGSFQIRHFNRNTKRFNHLERKNLNVEK